MIGIRVALEAFGMILDLPPRQYAEYRYFSASAATTSALTLAAEVTLVHFDLSTEHRFAPHL